ncbi:MAG: hypothetical protein SNJ82_10615 [Gemmataceae bacterium]
MWIRLLAMSLAGLTLGMAGCFHTSNCCRTAPPAGACCPPGTAPAVLPAPPPTSGYFPPTARPAFFRTASR